MKNINNKNKTLKQIKFGKLLLDGELSYNNLDIVTITEYVDARFKIKISDLEKAFNKDNYSGGVYILPIMDYGVETVLRYKMYKNKNDASIVFTGIIRNNKDISSDYDILITERVELSELQKLYDLVIHANHINSLIK